MGTAESSLEQMIFSCEKMTSDVVYQVDLRFGTLNFHIRLPAEVLAVLYFQYRFLLICLESDTRWLTCLAPC